MQTKIVNVAEDFARGGFFLVLGNVVSAVVSAISVLIVARILGPENYGLYSISTIVPSILALSLKLGMNQGLTKYLASLKVNDGERKIAKLLIHTLSFKSIAGLFLTIICFTFSDYFAEYILRRPEIASYIQLASLLIVLQELLQTLNSAFVGLDRAEYSALTTDTQAVVKAVISTLLVVLGLGIYGALTGYVASYMAACALGFAVFLFKIYRPLNRSGTHNCQKGEFLEDLKLLIKYGFPLYLSILIGGLVAHYQNILLAFFTSNEDIGNFKAAMNFNILITTISAPIATSLLPAFSKMEFESESIKNFFKHSVKYTSMVILPVATLIMLYSGEMVRIIYGESYKTASYFLSMSMLQYYFVGLGGIVLGSLFNGLGETKLSLRVTTVRSTVLVLFASALTYLFKIPGLIAAIIVSSLIGTLYGLSIAKLRFKVEIETKKIIRVYLASLIPAIPIVMLQKSLLLTGLTQMIIGASLYLTLYTTITPLTKTITKNELEEVKTIIYKTKPLKILTKPVFYFQEKLMSIAP
mgnify:CR=1 FL=1